MADVIVDISMSMDGFVTGPDDRQSGGLGLGGEPIHDWVFGGPWTYDGPRDEATGVGPGSPRRGDELGRSERRGPSHVRRHRRLGEDDWLGVPVFVVTHRPAPTRQVGRTSYHFVTDGVESAVRQAKEAPEGVR